MNKGRTIDRVLRHVCEKTYQIGAGEEQSNTGGIEN